MSDKSVDFLFLAALYEEDEAKEELGKLSNDDLHRLHSSVSTLDDWINEEHERRGEDD